MTTTRFISSTETYPLRLNVLWPHLSKLDECSLPIDDLDTTFHTGVEHENKVVTTATFLKENNNNFPTKNQYRLRAMASLPEVSGMGFGKDAVEFAIDELKNRGVELLWCDARKIALGFYEKIGFTVVGDYYEVRNIGPHKLAFLRL